MNADDLADDCFNTNYHEFATNWSLIVFLVVDGVDPEVADWAYWLIVLIRVIRWIRVRVLSGLGYVSERELSELTESLCAGGGLNADDLADDCFNTNYHEFLAYA